MSLPGTTDPTHADHVPLHSRPRATFSSSTPTTTQFSSPNSPSTGSSFPATESPVEALDSGFTSSAAVVADPLGSSTRYASHSGNSKPRSGSLGKDFLLSPSRTEGRFEWGMQTGENGTTESTLDQTTATGDTTFQGSSGNGFSSMVGELKKLYKEDLPLPFALVTLPSRRPRPIVLALGLLSALFFYRIFFSTKPSSPSLTLQRLTQNPPITNRGGNVARALTSYGNPYGFISLIDPYAGGVFNPSLLVMPDNVGLESRILMVARGPERYEIIDGEDTRWQTVFGLFVIPMKRKVLELPYLARESDLYTLKLPAARKMPFKRCAEGTFDQFVGAEDPRLFFTNDGQPLLLYSQTGRSPMICRAINIIDARVVVPGLKAAMDKAGWKAPIVFKEQTDLIRSEQQNIEKNWAPFLGDGDELWFHVTLVPQEIYKYVPHLTLRPLDPAPPAHNCLTDLIGADSSRAKFHHATPLMKVTMCKRGECVPDVGNTVMFGIIHVKYHPEPYLFYERRVVTWNTTAPYEYLSVSPPLTYMGTNQADPIFTVSMSWQHPTSRHGLGLNHGYLGERLLVSFGVFDYGSAYLEVMADDLLAEHQLCRPVVSRTLW